jgi:lipopolysaccharide assembly protein A
VHHAGGRSAQRAGRLFLAFPTERSPIMSVLRWIFISAIFLVLLFISLQNADPVTVRVFTFYSWQAPLVFVVLIAFAAGVALGLLAGAVKIARLRRQVSRMRREHHVQAGAVTAHPQLKAPGTTPASGPGFEPPNTGF